MASPETMIAEVVTPANDRVFDWCPRIGTNQYTIGDAR
jgi:hypothetical protein